MATEVAGDRRPHHTKATMIRKSTAIRLMGRAKYAQENRERKSAVLETSETYTAKSCLVTAADRDENLGAMRFSSS